MSTSVSRRRVIKPIQTTNGRRRPYFLIPRGLSFSCSAQHQHLSDDKSHTPPSPAFNEAPRQRGSRQWTQEQKDFLASALRVNHAGELAATLIYTAQNPPIIRAYPHLRNLVKHMYDQEANHFKQFNQLLPKYRIRPTALYPVWKVAATALGWGTAMMGREAAMACTEAVETEIGEHYNSQVKVFTQWIRETEARGESVDADTKELVESIKRIRDEELEHLDHAVEHDAKAARPYELLTNIIRGGCRGAIRLSERI